MHHDIVLLNTSNSTLNFLVEDVGEISECCDEITNCVMIAELSIVGRKTVQYVNLL